MNNYRIFLAVFLVVGLIGMIRGSDPVDAGDLYLAHVNVVNDGEDDLDDLNVKILIYDLGIVLRTNPFDLKDGDSVGKSLYWEVPGYINPGTYIMRITVSNDDEKDVKHRLITII